MMRRIIAKMRASRSDDRPTLTESARMQLTREYAQRLMEPERSVFEMRQAGKTTEQISQEMQIAPELVRSTLAKVYAELRVSLAD